MTFYTVVKTKDRDALAIELFNRGVCVRSGGPSDELYLFAETFGELFDELLKFHGYKKDDLVSVNEVQALAQEISSI